MRIIMYIGKTRALLGTVDGQKTNILHQYKYEDPIKKDFYHAADILGEIKIERWKEILDIYLKGQNQDRLLIQTWLKSTPQILTDDKSIESETPFRRPSLEDEHSDIPY